jgi:hypothetical protein
MLFISKANLESYLKESLKYGVVQCVEYKGDKTQKRSPEVALQAKFISLGNKTTKNNKGSETIIALHYDIDNKNLTPKELTSIIEQEIGETPLIVETDNGYHINFFLQDPIFIDSGKSLNYYKNTYTAIFELLTKAGLDLDKNAKIKNKTRLARNPLRHTLYNLERTGPFKLEDFKYARQKAKLFNSATETVTFKAPETIQVGERNTSIFNMLRIQAYKKFSRFKGKKGELKGGFDSVFNWLLDKGYSINNKLQQPLELDEINTIVKSISEFIWNIFLVNTKKAVEALSKSPESLKKVYELMLRFEDGASKVFNIFYGQKKALNTQVKLLKGIVEGKITNKDIKLLFTKNKSKKKASTRKIAQLVGLSHTTIDKYKEYLLEATKRLKKGVNYFHQLINDLTKKYLNLIEITNKYIVLYGKHRTPDQELSELRDLAGLDFIKLQA